VVENRWKVARVRRARVAKAEELPERPEPTEEPADPFYPPFKIEVNGILLVVRIPPRTADLGSFIGIRAHGDRPARAGKDRQRRLPGS
jgi:hypothetical protein